MDKAALVEADVQEGRRLIQALDEKGFSLRAALWFYLPDLAEWRLLLGSPLVDTDGPKLAYRRVQAVLTRMSPPSRLTLQSISIVSARDPLIQLLSSAIQTGPAILDIRFSKSTVNGTFIEDAYIYRLQAA